ncbi:MAG: hypothetical protein PHG20_00190 [Geobacteraceae bacterium]|nr:hypothetical protein [Geobacteraceae bacterium]
MLKKNLKIEDRDITVHELRAREVYHADISPPSSEMLPLYLHLDIDYPMVLAACDMPPEELVDLYPSDLDRIVEAFREMNHPLLSKPLVVESRQRLREILKKTYSELFALSLRQGTDQEPGTTP